MLEPGALVKWTEQEHWAVVQARRQANGDGQRRVGNRMMELACRLMLEIYLRSQQEICARLKSRKEKER